MFNVKISIAPIATARNVDEHGGSIRDIVLLLQCRKNLFSGQLQFEVLFDFRFDCNGPIHFFTKGQK
jgi:hypothetical protein